MPTKEQTETSDYLCPGNLLKDDASPKSSAALPAADGQPGLSGAMGMPLFPYERSRAGQTTLTA